MRRVPRVQSFRWSSGPVESGRGFFRGLSLSRCCQGRGRVLPMRIDRVREMGKSALSSRSVIADAVWGAPVSARAKRQLGFPALVAWEPNLGLPD
jgi:hypothetical protein